MAEVTSYAVGARGSVAIGEETIYGVAVTPSHLIGITGESVQAQENTLVSAELSPNRSVRNIVRSSFDISGDLNMEANASGHGMLYKHALGSYVRLQRVDGSIRGRMASETLRAYAGTDHALAGTQVIQFADEAQILFDDSGTFATVYKDAFGVLTAHDNAGAGYDYLDDSSTVFGRSYVLTGSLDAAATDYTGYAAQAVVSMILSPVYDAQGQLVNPQMSTKGGLLRFGNKIVAVFETAEQFSGSTPTGLKVWLSNNGVDEGVPGDPTTYPAEGDIVDILPTLLVDPSFSFLNASDGEGAVGTFVMQHHATGWDSVWTHHMESAAELPVGLTIEIDRDALVFVYTGNKINTMTLTAENQQIATLAFNFIGKREYASASLVEPAFPADTSIVIEGAEAVAFPDPASTGRPYELLTIADRRNIRYTTKTLNADGTVTLSGIPAAGDGAIDRFAIIGTSVDSRSQSRKTTDIRQSVNSPLVAHEIHFYIDGEAVEAQAFSITYSNNLTGDKYVLGSQERVAVIEQRRTVEGSVTYELDDGINYHKYKKGVNFAAELRCVSEADDAEILGADPGVVASATYFLPVCRYKGGTPNIEGEGFITHEMPFDAREDRTLNTADLCITLVNSNQYDAQDS